MRIFGRDPAVWVGVIEALLGAALAFNLFGTSLDKDDVLRIMAVVVAVFSVYTAYVTKDTMLAVGIGLAKAVIIMSVGFGVHLTEEQVGILITLVTVGLGFYNRKNTEPLAEPTLKEPPPVAVVASDLPQAA